MASPRVTASRRSSTCWVRSDYLDGGWHTDTCTGGGGVDIISCELEGGSGGGGGDDGGGGGGPNCDEKKSDHPKCPSAS